MLVTKIKYTNAIAEPMASEKLKKKIYKLIKKAIRHKACLRIGLKDVQKYLCKGEKGLVVFAGDVFPLEIMCHLPIVCEDKNIPYCYVPSRQDISAAMGLKRSNLAILIKKLAILTKIYMKKLEIRCSYWHHGYR